MKPGTFYYFDKGSDMIRLAREIQTAIYWGGHFRIKDEDNEQRYTYFWDNVEHFIDLGYTGCYIENNIVEFVK